jgi:hypothetical protein
MRVLIIGLALPGPGPEGEQTPSSNSGPMALKPGTSAARRYSSSSESAGDLEPLGITSCGCREITADPRGVQKHNRCRVQ